MLHMHIIVYAQTYAKRKTHFIVFTPKHLGSTALTSVLSKSEQSTWLATKQMALW